MGRGVSALLLLAACKREPASFRECDAQRPCRQAWTICHEGSCQEDHRPPPPPQFGEPQFAMPDGGSAVVVRLGLQSAPGATVAAFLTGGCQGQPLPVEGGAAVATLAPGTATISARSANPWGNESPCVEKAFAIPKPPRPDTPEQRAADAEAQKFLSDARERQARFVAALPPALAEALKARKLLPFGAVAVGRTLVTADLDCDGKPDQAIVALAPDDPLTHALVVDHPANEEAAASRDRLLRMDDGEAGGVVVVALANADGSLRLEQHGSSARLSVRRFFARLGCDEDLGSKLDVKWAEEHGCSALEYGATDTGGGSFLAFDHARGRLVEFSDACE